LPFYKKLKKYVPSETLTPKEYSLKLPKLLHSEYTLLDYVESNGNQYINTEFTPTNDNYGIEIKLNMLNSIGTANDFIGYRSVDSATYIGDMRYLFIYSDRRLAVRNGVNAENSTSAVINLNTIYNLKYENKKLYVNNTLYVTSTQQSSNPSYQPFYLFRTNTTGYFSGDLSRFIGRIYYCKLYNNNVLVKHLLPAKRKSDNAIGMYDKVSGTFHTNLGSGNFSYGKEISDVYTYQQLEYIQSSETQYIDTNFKSTGKTTFKSKWYVLKDTGNYCLYGACNGGVYNAGERSVFNYEKKLETVIPTSNSASVISPTINDVWYKNRYLEFEDLTDKFIVNGTAYTRDNFYSNYVCDRNMVIFAVNRKPNGALYNSTVRLLYFKIYEDGTLVRDFVPVKRIYDGTIGLYDKVNETFYTNQGTGTFIAGPNLYKKYELGGTING